MPNKRLLPMVRWPATTAWLSTTLKSPRRNNNPSILPFTTMRETIFNKIRSATAGIKSKEPYPGYDSSIVHSSPKLAGDDLWEIFSRNFSGEWQADVSIAQLGEFLISNGQRHGYCDPGLYDSVGTKLVAAGLTVEMEYDREPLRRLSVRHHPRDRRHRGIRVDHSGRFRHLAPTCGLVALGACRGGGTGEILRTIPDAIAAFGDSPNIIWVTGPSKTADVEGILIEGVHGPGEQIALMLEL